MPLSTGHRGTTARMIEKEENTMSNNGNLVAQISTVIAGFVLSAYGLAFLANTASWL